MRARARVKTNPSARLITEVPTFAKATVGYFIFGSLHSLSMK